MKVFISDNYKAMSEKALDEVKQLMKLRANPLICTASGDSPAGLYKELVENVNLKELDASNWYFVSLDEWAGMNGNDEGSCRFHLNNDLFNPLQIPAERICFFDGRADDLEEECLRIENFIKEHGGIDVAIIGLGMNGHAGMNEPGTSPDLYSHIAEIDPITQKVGQKYFKEQKQLSQGLTLGIASLMKIRHIMLLVSGSKKAEIVQRVLEGEISVTLPASLLRNHPNFKVYLDREAAGMLHAG
jgi:glucosamine-6-phosphate isomerase